MRKLTIKKLNKQEREDNIPTILACLSVILLIVTIL